MGTFTAWTVLKMSLELFLGICLKLFIENGRIHWRDFVNDFLFWLPGVQQQEDDGLSRQVAAMNVAVPEEPAATALAAK